MTTAPEPFIGHTGAVHAIAVLPDGRRIVTGGDDTTIRAWDLRTGLLLDSHETHRDRVLAVSATDDERVLSWGRTRMVVWDVANRVTSWTPHLAPVRRAAISTRGAVVAIDLGENVLSPTGGPGWPSGHGRIDNIAVTATGDVITAGDEPLVRVMDRSGNELGRVEDPGPDKVAVASSADGMQVVYVGRDGVRYWDRRQTDRRVQLIGCTDAVALAVTPDGRQVVAGGSGGGIWVWDPDWPARPIRMRGHGSPVRSFAVTPDCKQLISGADDGTIRVWDLATGADVFHGRKPKQLPELASDQESALDLLGFAGDVDSIAALIADRETTPPLAIALLGRWGSGKSSFMRQLQDRVAGLADQGSHISVRSVFATAVHQVRFDAWHFNDDHLWVGMVEHLFAGLAGPALPDAEGVRAERDALREKLRDLEELTDTEVRATRRVRARLRLWSASLVPRRGRIALTGAAVALLGAVTGLTWWLSEGAVVTWVLGVLTAVVASPVVTWLITAWRAVRGFTGRRALELSQELRDTRVRLARLDATQRLGLVIEEARSAGFDEYRGLLGRVHADLRRLSDSARQAFAEWSDAGSKGTPPLERVILYIDDLDRCSPRKVVDVLAAVHLLLALPLFVVVVAVDPRWLRRCLEQYHSELFGGRADGAGAVTPLDYLDKIFQVVFALRPMGKEADRFVEEIVRTEDVRPDAIETIEARGRPEPGGEDNVRPNPAGDTPTTQPSPDPPGRPDRPDHSDEPTPQPGRLRLRAAELLLIQRLRRLLDTPRAVKRFVNQYRLVRVAIADDELDGFIGADRRGPYQAVLVLLAVLVSDPEGWRTLHAALRESERGESFATLVADLASAEQSSQARDVWTRLREVMRDGDPTHDSLSTYREWAGTIARFSFETWDLTKPR